MKEIQYLDKMIRDFFEANNVHSYDKVVTYISALLDAIISYFMILNENML